MRVAVLGSWHLGCVTAACLAGVGHQTTVWDADPLRVAALAAGAAPVSEPGLQKLLQHGLDSGNLSVAAGLARAVAGAELVWITLDTHINDDDTVDLSELDALVGRLGPLLNNDTSVAVSSQVPVGTCERWWDQLNTAGRAHGKSLTGIAYMPENLRLGEALARFRRPDMIVIGSNDQRTGDRLQDLISFTEAPVVRTDLRSAELIKHAINSFLATSISFANEIASVADLVGADAVTVARAMRLDERIGSRARVGPGLAFAGGTLARDVTTLVGIGRAAGRPALLAEAVLEVNRRHAEWPLRRLEAELDPAEATVGIFGLTYTVGTSTLRRSQSVPLIKALTARGAQVRVHDPEADLSEAEEALDLVRADTPYAAAAGCDAIVLLTPWAEYLDLDWSRIAESMRGDLIIDGPNALDHASVASAGLAVIGPGRASELGVRPVTDDNDGRQTLSVVVPAYNEELNIDRAYARISTVLLGLGLRRWELIFSVDPSTDGTEPKIAALNAQDPRVRLIRMSRRFGQPAATIAGMAAASGDAVVIIDCDLQDPPELIADMVVRWREGYDVVYAQRRSREGERIAKRIVSWVGYRIIRRIAEVEIPPNVGDFRLMSRRVVENVVALDESHGFLRGLVGLVGFRQTAVLYDRHPRAAGASKYNQVFGSLRIGLNGIVGFSRYPLQVISLAGMLFSVLAFLGAVGYGVLRILGLGFPGGGTIIILVVFFAGIELLSLGVMGEYVGRIYDEVKHRPKYIVESRIGFPDPGAATSEADAAHSFERLRHYDSTKLPPGP